MIIEDSICQYVINKEDENDYKYRFLITLNIDSVIKPTMLVYASTIDNALETVLHKALDDKLKGDEIITFMFYDINEYLANDIYQRKAYKHIDLDYYIRISEIAFSCDEI